MAQTSYYFKAVGADGKVRTGSLHADSDQRVAAELKRQGLIPVYVGAEQRKGFEFKLPQLGGGRKKDVLFFTQELSTLLNSGVPLDRALSITSELTERPAFQIVLADILRILKGGRSLADSLAAHPDYFSDLYINMVRAGEASGTLGVIFERLAIFERTRDELRGFIISSLIYPALLASVGLLSIVVLLTFVVPRFAQVFTETRIQMPLPTQMLFLASEFLTSWGWLIGLALTAGGVAFAYWVKSPEGRLGWDRIRLRLPLLGDALRKAETARFARAMSTLVANGVPLVQSLGISRAILTNQVLARSLEAVAQGVKRGEGIAQPLKRVGVFPVLAGHLLSVGEETGRLDQMFSRMADIYEEDTKTAIKRFTTVFEPLVILIMGVIIGGLILSMLFAITSMNEVAI
ncbi:MAG: type II secretion system F family protein [Bryobacter sp.]|jgi:general secretion pathway protein F|nr:type II secretion system F family protein [Bryobacter sp.]